MPDEVISNESNEQPASADIQSADAPGSADLVAEGSAPAEGEAATTAVADSAAQADQAAPAETPAADPVLSAQAEAAPAAQAPTPDFGGMSTAAFNVETKTYPDSTTATGVALLPEESPVEIGTPESEVAFVVRKFHDALDELVKLMDQRITTGVSEVRAIMGGMRKHFE